MIAPEISRTITARPQSPWFNEDCQEAKRCLRRLERRWRKSRLEVDRQLFIKESEKYNKLLSEAKRSHFHQELQDCGPRSFFSKVSKLLEKSEKILPKVRILNSTLSNLFCNYFATKIENIVESLNLLCDQSPSGEWNVPSIKVDCK